MFVISGQLDINECHIRSFGHHANQLYQVRLAMQLTLLKLLQR